MFNLANDQLEELNNYSKYLTFNDHLDEPSNDPQLNGPFPYREEIVGLYK